jgi:hypothetical protein
LPSTLNTPTLKLSHEAQQVVGSPDGGSSTLVVAVTLCPVFTVLISNVLRQSAQMWLKQHFGSQE